MSGSKIPDLLPERSEKRAPWKRVALLVAAAVFFVVGTVGWIVPIVAGFPFYIASLVLLAMASDRMRKWINALDRKLSDRWRLKIRKAVRKLPSRKLRAAVKMPEPGAA